MRKSKKVPPRHEIVETEVLYFDKKGGKLRVYGRTLPDEVTKEQDDNPSPDAQEE